MINTVSFPGDMSASRVSTPLAVGQGNTTFALDIACPSTDTPVGVITVEDSIHGDPSGDWNVYSVDGTNPLQITVNGAGIWHLRDYAMRAAYVRIRYTRASGGTAANFYDGSSTGANKPLAFFS